MVDGGRAGTPQVAAAAVAALVAVVAVGASCSGDFHAIRSGQYTCIDDSDCAWGWRCRALASARHKVCIHPDDQWPPLSQVLLPPDVLADPGDPGPPPPDASSPVPSCGNGLLEPGEQCDDGPLNSLLPDAPCRPDCTRRRCGDGVLDSDESCDDATGACDRSRCQLDPASRLVVDPPALHLGAVGLDGCEPPRVRELAVHNPTPIPLTIERASLLGCTAELRLEQPGTGGVVLPGQARTVRVELVPQTEGIKSCRLRIEASDGYVQAAVTAAVGPRDRQTDELLQRARQRVDILLLVNPSKEMAAERLRLLKASPAFAEAALNAWTDFHLGSVSTVQQPSSPPIAADVSLGRLQGDPRFISNDPTTDFGAELRTRVDLPIRSGSQRGIDALLAALSPALTASVDPASCQACEAPRLCIAGGCRQHNWGFRRGDASLEIVVITDEPDASQAGVGEVLEQLRRRVNPLLGHSVRLHGLLPALGACERFDYTPRWEALIERTGGKRYDLCTATYVPVVKAVAQQLFGLGRSFSLTRRPLPATIEVEVDGQPVASTTYRAASNTVTLQQPPAASSRVTIRYQVDCSR